MQLTLFWAVLLVACATAAGQQMPGERLPTSPLKPPPSIPGKQSAEQLVKITATADVPQVGPGEKFHLAFIFDIQPEWHIYWRNAGAGGAPTSVQIHGPQEFVIGQTLFPRPKAFTGEEGTSYGYDGKVVLYVEVTAPLQIATASVMFTARINFMVCKDVCLLGRFTQVINLLTRSGPGRGPDSLLPKVDPAVKEFKSRLPRPLKELNGAEANYESGTLTIKLPAQGFSTAQFFPVELPGVTYDEATVQKSGDQIVITVPVTVNVNNALGNEMKIAGTVGLGESQTDPCYDLEIPLPSK